MPPAKDVAGEIIVGTSAVAGKALASAGIAAAVSAAATNVAVAATGAHLATMAGGAFASLIAGTGMSIAPAWWAVLITNPVTAPIAIGAGTIAGVAAGLKLVKKILQ